MTFKFNYNLVNKFPPPVAPSTREACNKTTSVVVRITHYITQLRRVSDRSLFNRKPYNNTIMTYIYIMRVLYTYIRYVSGRSYIFKKSARFFYYIIVYTYIS